MRLTCNSSGDTMWLFTKDILNPERWPISRNNFFSLSEVKFRSGGYYYCYGLYKDGKNHFVGKTKLKVYGEFGFKV